MKKRLLRLSFFVTCASLTATPVVSPADPPPAGEVPVFNYSGFGGIGGLTLLSSAQQSGDTIMLTRDILWTYGTVAYNRPVDLGQGFAMDATFSITSSGQPADGLVFRFQPNLDEFGNLGGTLNILNAPGLFVTLDTFTNVDYGDPASPSVAVIGCGVGHGADPNHFNGCTPALVPLGFSIADGTAHSILITYFGGQFGVRVDGNFVIDIPLALTDYIVGPVYAEVTGVTGGLSQQATLRSWDLASPTSTPEPAGTAVLGLLLVISSRVLRRGKTNEKPWESFSI